MHQPVSGLRSSYDRVGGLVYFGRMLDKIRLHAVGKLPAAYHANLSQGFDLRTCAFLRINYSDLVARVAQGGTDEEILAWAFTQGGAHSDAECFFWNGFMMKRGWRDDSSAHLREKAREFGLTDKPIETWFDLNEYDEGRDPVGTRAWEKA